MYLFGACSLFVKKNRLVFGPYRPEKEICYFNKNSKFKFQTDIDRHGPRPLLNHRHLAEPPPFSLYTTFNYPKETCVRFVFLKFSLTREGEVWAFRSLRPLEEWVDPTKDIRKGFFI
jgi:hypothetical protein